MRPLDQGALPPLRIALGTVRLLRQPALDQGRWRRRGRGSRNGPAQLREVHALRRAGEGGARLRRGHHLHLDTDDSFWERLHRHYSEPELVELGCFIALTMGQQSWLRLLNIDHHQVLAGTSASMAPGYESEDALKRSKSDPQYWARQKR